MKRLPVPSVNFGQIGGFLGGPYLLSSLLPIPKSPAASGRLTKLVLVQRIQLSVFDRLQSNDRRDGRDILATCAA